MMKITYSREELVKICEQAIVPENKWCNRDSASAQANIGKCWAYLKAGCDFRVMCEESDNYCISDERTIWVEIIHDGFECFEVGKKSRDVFYLPTPERIAEHVGNDWY